MTTSVEDWFKGSESGVLKEVSMNCVCLLSRDTAIATMQGPTT